MVFQLSKISRELMDFDRTLSPHQDILGSFEIAAIKIFGEEYKFFVRTLIGEYQKLARVIKNNSDYLNELRKTNDTLLNTKQNRVIQFLTVVAFIGMPLTIITSLLQIDTVSRPIVGHSNDFWIISGILVTLGLIMYFFFKKKNWL
jgi:magnesium transporter